MIILLFISIFVPLSLFLARTFALKADRGYLVCGVLIAWIFLGLLTVVVNNWMPFSGAGDDEDYYLLADNSILSAADALNFNRFVGSMEQPGYAWVLSIINEIFGRDILLFKLLNLFFLILLSIIWYIIGIKIESARFAKSIFLVILGLTPLWYYFFFILKDILITLVQSFFVLMAINIWKKPKINHIILSLLSLFFILILRTPLLIQNATVLLGGLLSKSFAGGMRDRRFFPLFVASLIVAAAAPIVTNTNTLAIFGIYVEHRVVGSTAMFETASAHGASSEMNRALFPLLYLITETAGFSPIAWEALDGYWLRGILALPWIAFIVPFFPYGLYRLFRSPIGVRPNMGLVSRLRYSKVFTTPWSIILIFILTSFSISWFVGDTTRWRLPDMPFLAAVALAGWLDAPRNARVKILLFWIIFISIAYTVFYILGV